MSGWQFLAHLLALAFGMLGLFMVVGNRLQPPGRRAPVDPYLGPFFFLLAVLFMKECG